MLSFRRPTPAALANAAPTPADIRALISDLVAPAHFFTGPPVALDGPHAVVEEVPWEVFQGRLLDAAHSFQRRTFEAWNLFLIEDGVRSTEPLLAVKWDGEQLHVVRAVHCYVQEGYHAGGNVYLSREGRRWVRELVGTVEPARCRGVAELRDELIGLLFRAVVGSRLPLTSLEAPLPAFSLGWLAYFYQPGCSAPAPARSASELIDRLLTAELSWLEKAKLLETLLHAAPADALDRAAAQFVERWRALGHPAGEIPALFRTLFNEVSLSPYTDLVDKALAFLHHLEEQGTLDAAEVVDLLGHLLRQTGRHLTAYDLVTFHHGGANYPDALLLDALLKDYLAWIERQPALFLDGPAAVESEAKARRLRRRALRQGWLLRRRYEGHLVPDAPTSQGENLRVLPAALPRVPEEQIQMPHRRSKRLFAGDPLPAHLQGHGRAALAQSIHDLHHPLELRELGMALFLDRPLGAAKGPVEPDQTLLLSYEAFSRSTAKRRLDLLAELLEPAERDQLRRRLRELRVDGLPVEAIGSVARPGVVSLADARRAAEDFVLLRTTARGVADFLAQYDLAPLAERFALDWLTPSARVLLVGEVRGGPSPEVVLRVFDAELRQRLELVADLRAGYARRAGVEFPVNGLRAEGVVLRPLV